MSTPGAKTLLTELRKDLILAYQTLEHDSGRSAIHNYRVLVKRLRAFLALRRFILGTDIHTQQRKRLKRIYHCAGDIREAQLLRTELRDLGEASEIQDLRRRLKKKIRRKKKELDRLLAELPVKKFKRWLKRWFLFLEDVPEEALPVVCEAYLTTELLHIRQVRSHMPTSESLHRLRKSLKRRHYLHELCYVPATSQVTIEGERLPQATRALGSWHDQYVLYHLIRDELHHPEWIQEHFARLLESEEKALKAIDHWLAWAPPSPAMN